jgi:glutamine---fructose-6-phosphate transaminase (isomerizing)
MTTTMTAMLRETCEAPDVVARLFAEEAANFRDLGRHLRQLSPSPLATCARGSSDHAAAFFKYATEILIGIPVASIGPSIASIYDAPLKMQGGAVLSVSQSGKSPDLVALQAKARAGGAFAIALVNVEDSPLAREADALIPLHAGPETSVAATKSFIASVAAAARIVAEWAADNALLHALEALPDHLAKALRMDWSPAARVFTHADSMFVVGRGTGFPVAQEMALKCKETCALHAEAFSAAEVMHGPLRLVQDQFPVLALVPEDAAVTANIAGIEKLKGAGGNVFTATARNGLSGTHLPTVDTGHGITDSIAMALSFYRFIEGISLARGFDPDRPVNLAKVTETR